MWAAHQTLTDPEHLDAAKKLRRARVGLVKPAVQAQVQVRDLTTYDQALGLEGGVA